MAITTPTPQSNSGTITNGTNTQDTASGAATASQSSGSATGQQAQQQAQVYNPWQQSEQQQAGQAASSFLQTGNLPGTLGAPPAETQAYINNFNQNVAPQLAAQYGAGSPAIASQEALGLSQLAGSEYSQGISALSGAIGQEANIGFNAIGSNQAGAQSSAQESQNKGESTDWQTLTNTLNEGTTNTATGFTFK
jgi:hypothetical protein